jgi:hypothetical protein
MTHHSAFNIVQNSYIGRSHYSRCSIPYVDAVNRALKPPGYHKEWHIGVRVSANKKLVAFISGVPVSLRVRDK